MVLLVGTLATGVLANLNLMLAYLVGALSLAFGYMINQTDRERRTYSLEYDLDNIELQKWVSKNTALAALTNAAAMWRITTEDRTYDWKRNAGASTLLSRAKACIAQQPAKYIASNITPYTLNIGTQRLSFFPDRVYVLEMGKYGAIEYSSLSIDSGQTSFIESGQVPPDTEITGYTWQYVNKNGSPDRRFNNNRQIPVVNYGVISIQSVTGLNLVMHVSSVAITRDFASKYRAAPASATRPPQSSPRPDGGKYQSKPQQRWQYNDQGARQQPDPPRPKPSSVPNTAPPECYKVLGLHVGCTRDQAHKSYLELANKYHPDRVNNLAPEFRALAHQMMERINNAYTELKRIRGW